MYINFQQKDHFYMKVCV